MSATACTSPSMAKITMSHEQLGQCITSLQSSRCLARFQIFHSLVSIKCKTPRYQHSLSLNLEAANASWSEGTTVKMSHAIIH